MEAASTSPGDQPAQTRLGTNGEITPRPQGLELLNLELETDAETHRAPSAESASSRGFRAKLVRDLEAYLARAAAELDQRGDALLARAAKIEEENQRLTAAEANLEERNRRLAELDLADAEVSLRVDGLLRLVAERDVQLSQSAKELEQSQRDLESATREIGEREQRLSELQQRLRGFEERLSGLEQRLGEREQIIASQRTELAERERAIATLREEHAGREASIRTRLEAARRSASEGADLLSRLASNTQLQANNLAALQGTLEERTAGSGDE